jgi:hypothetical protein
MLTVKPIVLICIFLACIFTGCESEAERRAKEDAAFWKFIAVGAICIVVVISLAAAASENNKSKTPKIGEPPPKPVIDIQSQAAPVSRPAPPNLLPSAETPIAAATDKLVRISRPRRPDTETRTSAAADKPVKSLLKPITGRKSVAPAEVKPKATAHLSRYIIDGSNVCRSFDRFRPPSLAILLSLLLEIQRRGGSFICFFDASAPNLFEETGGPSLRRAYDDLAKALPQCFVQVPARTQADDFILSHADKECLPIISNDQFKDYFHKYRWLEYEAERRIPGVVINSAVTVLPLQIEVPLENDVSLASRKLVELVRG